ncbi:hypothetical protein D9758_002305 [Tetrapyrgos nigripes]|uniref:Uncharacterized protein n=1 Tax=Tetrapyrgos nigripes TaxID=182062 RepID=A0A8H5GNT4_9AGAR|nr:hypothetical protein D9758_002305 [Tetrapyrgos nigripes]
MSSIATPTLALKRSVHFPEILAKSTPRKSSMVYPRVAQNRAIQDRKGSYDLCWQFEKLSVAASLPDICQLESGESDRPSICSFENATSKPVEVTTLKSPKIPSTPFASPRICSSFTPPHLNSLRSQLVKSVNKGVYCSSPLLGSNFAPPMAGLSTDSLTSDSYVSGSSSSSGSESE